MINRIHGGNTIGAGLIDFSININPLGTPPKIKKIIIENLDGVERYPQPDSKRLRDALAAFHKIKSDNLLIGNGSIELIYLLPKALGSERVLTPLPTFSEYEFSARAAGATVLFAKAKEEDGFKIKMSRLAGLTPKVDTIFLCNPNNPTGHCFSRDEILSLIDASKRRKATLVIDEAFIDFVRAGDELGFIREAAENKFLLVLRSLTKFFAIPGLRLGYLIGHRDLINRISRFQHPWNVNSLAQLAGEEIIKDAGYIRKSREFVLKEKERLFNDLKQINGLKVYPPSCNFIFCKLEYGRLDGANELQQRLLKRGIVIRNCDNFRGLNNRFFRVAVRKKAENIKLIKALRDIL